MGGHDSRRPHFEGWLAAQVASPRSRRGLLAAIACGSAIASLAICSLAYWVTGVHPDDRTGALIAYGLPALVPLTLSPLVVGVILRLLVTLHERSERLEEEVRRRGRAEARLAVLVTTDDLTQIPNRRAFFARAAEIANGTGAVSTVAVLDLDDFKQLNDTHGHAAGDAALRRCGDLLRARTDRAGVAARLGGEEFGIILPGRPAGASAAFLDELRRSFSATAHGLTVSIGASDWLPAERIDIALARADSALYRAKQRGRNRVEILPADDTDSSFGTDLAPVARR